jgi:hypothetical protein
MHSGGETGAVTNRVFGEENPTPCTFVIVPGSVSYHVQNSLQNNIISIQRNQSTNHNFTSETTRYTNLVQAPWAKRQVEILRSGS